MASRFWDAAWPLDRRATRSGLASGPSGFRMVFALCGSALCKRGQFGGPEGIRTPDLLTASQTRSQLRHGPTKRPAEKLMIPPTFRPPLRSPLADGDP